MHVDVTGRGEVSGDLKRYAVDKVGALDRYVGARALRAHVVLTQESNPRIERPARAEGEIDLHGPIVRGQVTDLEMQHAIDALAERLERQLRRFVDRQLDEQRRPAHSSPGEWRHGDWAAPLPSTLRRPSEEREIVRRKTFAVQPMTPSEAAQELEALDHGFYLFRDIETGADAVVYRRDDGRLGVIGPAGIGWTERGGAADGFVREESRTQDPTQLRDAVAEMNELNHRFMYFVNAENGRGNVIYLRYDGHYGLIEPSIETIA